MKRPPSGWYLAGTQNFPSVEILLGKSLALFAYENTGAKNHARSRFSTPRLARIPRDPFDKGIEKFYWDKLGDVGLTRLDMAG